MIFQTAQLAEMFKLLRPTTAFSNEEKKNFLTEGTLVGIIRVVAIF